MIASSKEVNTIVIIVDDVSPIFKSTATANAKIVSGEMDLRKANSSSFCILDTLIFYF